MKTNAEELTIQWLDSRIARIRKKLDKEMKNLRDSGIVQGDPMYDEVWYTIQKEFHRDIMPYAVVRHQLRPFEGEELKMYSFWMSCLDLGKLEKPPEEMKYASLPSFKKVLRQLINK